MVKIIKIVLYGERNMCDIKYDGNNLNWVKVVLFEEVDVGKNLVCW